MGISLQQDQIEAMREYVESELPRHVESPRILTVSVEDWNDGNCEELFFRLSINLVSVGYDIDMSFWCSGTTGEEMVDDAIDTIKTAASELSR